MKPVIEVQHVSKKYKVVDPATGAKQPYWGLTDITFEVERGAGVALVGENGAGKSTLMKIIANIVTPTSGQVIVRGYAAAMLELGAGFHHELTGRENTYVFGALMGIRRKEIKQKFEEIVDFAEVGPFIDTKVRAYSSGMILRLAFSIASSLRPDVILADELLAVSDVDFRAKALERMKAVKKEGTAIVLVQHDEELIRDICDDAVLLKKGVLIERVPVKELKAS